MGDSDQLDFNFDKVDIRMGDLLDSFESHPLMQPPDVNPSVFFLFDFVRTTHRNFKSIDAQKFKTGDQQSRQAAQDVSERNQFTDQLVNDRSGKLAAMTGDDPANPVDFGDEIRHKTKALVEA